MDLGHRPGRLGPARAGQAADHDGDARGGDRGDQGARRGPADRVRGHGAAPAVDRAWTLPVWVAGYGPMALAMTGRVADGVILQLADPDLIRWFVGQVREAAAAAGRDPGSVKVQAAAPAHVGTSRGRPRADALVPGARQQPRRRPRQQVPARAAARVADRLHPRPRPGYDYLHHAEVGSSNAGFVGDEVTDRFCVLGSRRRPRRQAPRARGRGRRPVQHLPDERRRGGPARGLRPRRHPGPARGSPANAPWLSQTGDLAFRAPVRSITAAAAHTVACIPGLDVHR